MIILTQSNQEAFDIVVAHLISMKHPSVGRLGHCAYRGIDGSCCAIGKLISDDDYLPPMEGQRVTALIESGFLNPGNLSEDLLSDLQYTHDNRKHWGEDGFNVIGLKALLIIANKFKLGIKGEIFNEIHEFYHKNFENLLHIEKSVV